MLHHYEQIRELLHRVRSRWKARSIFLAAVRASLAASAVLGVVLVLVAREPARQTLDAASLALFPSRVTLEVTPGSARIKFGTPLAIEARLVGNRAPIVAQVQIGEGDHWRASEMTTEASGTFRL